jgi:extracellular factor (EF) 3-hydroxypalmitic acid methyl ester biosynthesis protein
MERFRAQVANWSAGLTADETATIVAAFHALADELNALRDSLAPYAWDELILALRTSELLPILLQEPLTRWSYHRTGGYPGDAQLISLICTEGDIEEGLVGVSAIGRRLHRALRSRTLCTALQDRERVAAEVLGGVASRTSAASLLAIRAAHLREIGTDQAATWGRIVAVDHDQAALDKIAARLPNAERRRRPTRDILSGQPEGERFDAIYAPALFDCLPKAAAGRTLSRLRALLRPCGRLVICNFAPDAADRGYMEAFMDWKLIGRDEDDMRRLATHANPDGETRVYREHSGQVVILETLKDG